LEGRGDEDVFHGSLAWEVEGDRVELDLLVDSVEDVFVGEDPVRLAQARRGVGLAPDEKVPEEPSFLEDAHVDGDLLGAAEDVDLPGGFEDALELLHDGRRIEAVIPRTEVLPDAPPFKDEILLTRDVIRRISHDEIDAVIRELPEVFEAVLARDRVQLHIKNRRSS